MRDSSIRPHISSPSARLARILADGILVSSCTYGEVLECESGNAGFPDPVSGWRPAEFNESRGEVGVRRRSEERQGHMHARRKDVDSGEVELRDEGTLVGDLGTLKPFNSYLGRRYRYKATHHRSPPLDPGTTKSSSVHHPHPERYIPPNNCRCVDLRVHHDPREKEICDFKVTVVSTNGSDRSTSNARTFVDTSILEEHALPEFPVDLMKEILIPALW